MLLTTTATTIAARSTIVDDEFHIKGGETAAAPKTVLSLYNEFAGKDAKKRKTPPLFKVITPKGDIRGVFWCGLHKGEMSIGTCRLTNAGHLHGRSRYDGTFFNKPEELKLAD